MNSDVDSTETINNNIEPDNSCEKETLKDLMLERIQTKESTFQETCSKNESLSLCSKSTTNCGNNIPIIYENEDDNYQVFVKTDNLLITFNKKYNVVYSSYNEYEIGLDITNKIDSLDSLNLKSKLRKNNKKVKKIVNDEETTKIDNSEIHINSSSEFNESIEIYKYDEKSPKSDQVINCENNISSNKLNLQLFTDIDVIKRESRFLFCDAKISILNLELEVNLEFKGTLLKLINDNEHLLKVKLMYYDFNKKKFSDFYSEDVLTEKVLINQNLEYVESLKKIVRYEEKIFIKICFEYKVNADYETNKNDLIQNKAFTNLVGIRNIKNTCYFNSIIQTLFSFPFIRMIVRNIDFTNTDFPLKEDDLEEIKVISVIQEMNNLMNIKDYHRKSMVLHTSNDKLRIINFIKQLNFCFYNLYCKKETFQPHRLISFSSNYQAGQQQDFEEYYRYILDDISHFDVNNICKNNFRMDIIQLLYKQNLYNEKSEVISVKRDEIFFISLDIYNCISTATKEDNIKGDLIEEDEFSFLSKALPNETEFNTITKCIQQYFEEECIVNFEYNNDRIDVIKKLKLFEFPNVLPIQLNRFHYNKEKFKMVKVNNYVYFPDILHLKNEYKFHFDDDFNLYNKKNNDYAKGKQCNKDLFGINSNNEDINNDNITKYKLYSVVIHNGSFGSGHYYTYIRKNIEGKIKFVRFNDSYCQIISNDKIVTKYYSGGDYHQIDLNEGKFTYDDVEISDSAYILFYVKESEFLNIIENNNENNITENIFELYDNKNDECCNSNSNYCSNKIYNNNNNNKNRIGINEVNQYNVNISNKTDTKPVNSINPNDYLNIKRNNIIDMGSGYPIYNKISKKDKGKFETDDSTSNNDESSYNFNKKNDKVIKVKKKPPSNSNNTNNFNIHNYNLPDISYFSSSNNNDNYANESNQNPQLNQISKLEKKEIPSKPVTDYKLMKKNNGKDIIDRLDERAKEKEKLNKYFYTEKVYNNQIIKEGLATIRCKDNDSNSKKIFFNI